MKNIIRFFIYSVFSLFIICSIEIKKGSNLLSFTKNWIASKQVSLEYKVFDKQEAKDIFGKDLIKKGIYPIYIKIKNRSKFLIHFNPNKLSIPYKEIKKVSKKAHQPMLVKSLIFNFLSFFFTPISIVSAIDTFSDLAKNRMIDTIFKQRALKESLILPNQTVRGLIFVDKEDYEKSIQVSVKNVEKQLNLEIMGKKIETFSSHT